MVHSALAAEHGARSHQLPQLPIGMLRRLLGATFRHYQRHVIARVLGNQDLLSRFRHGRSLPARYGAGLSERCIELPWALAQIATEPGRLLDAGSALNFGYLLDSGVMHNKQVHIVTLAPEKRAYWQRGVSYLYTDLRRLPVCNEHYDVSTCISTLEHVGLDNSGYAGAAFRERRPDDFSLVMSELARVLRPGGQLLLTVPYGRSSDFGWFRVFDKPLLKRAVDAFDPLSVTETYYRAGMHGWNIANVDECRDASYSLARKSAEAVACLHLVKR